MKSVLFCNPLKQNTLLEFKKFVELTQATRREEWQDMLKRYDIKSVSIWYKTVDNVDHVYVHHFVGDEFSSKIQHWHASQHEFDLWFDQQLATFYAAGPIASEATLLLDMKVE